MREKDIKRQVLKQLKKNFPNWRKLKRNEKKRSASEVLAGVLAENSGTKQAATVPIHELTETPIPMEGIIKLADMEAFIQSRTRNLLLFPVRQWPKQFEDVELQAIDKLIVCFRQACVHDFFLQGRRGRRWGVMRGQAERRGVGVCRDWRGGWP